MKYNPYKKELEPTKVLCADDEKIDLGETLRQIAASIVKEKLKPGANNVIKDVNQIPVRPIGRPPVMAMPYDAAACKQAVDDEAIAESEVKLKGVLGCGHCHEAPCNCPTMPDPHPPKDPYEYFEKDYADRFKEAEKHNTQDLSTTNSLLLSAIESSAHVRCPSCKNLLDPELVLAGVTSRGIMKTWRRVHYGECTQMMEMLQPMKELLATLDNFIIDDPSNLYELLYLALRKFRNGLSDSAVRMNRGWSLEHRKAAGLAVPRTGGRGVSPW